MIQIKRQAGGARVTVFETPINEGCRISGKLMDSASVNLKFATDCPIVFKVGDYIDLREAKAGEDEYDYAIPEFAKMKYVLKDIQYPVRNATTGGYDYDLKFVAFHEAWKNIVYKFVIGISGDETKWTYTGMLREHLAIFLENIKANSASHIFGDFLDEQLERLGLTKYDELNEYNVFDVDDEFIEDRHVFLSFDGVKIGDVISTLCSADNYDCDFWYDGTFHFGKCEMGEVLELDSYSEDPECTVASSMASGEYANRIIFYGGERNLTARYRRELDFISNEMILEVPQGTSSLSSYNGNDYEFFFRDKTKPNLSIDIIKRKNKRESGKNYYIFKDLRLKSYNQGEFTSSWENAEFPFGQAHHEQYQYANPYELVGFENFYSFGTETVNLGIIGSHVVRVFPKFRFFPHAWFSNNSNDFLDDGLENGGRVSREVPISATYIHYKLRSGGNIISEKVIYGYYHDGKWNSAEASNVVNIPTTYEFIPPEEYAPKDPVTLNAEYLGTEITLEVSYGIVLREMDKMGDYFFRCEMDGSVYLTGGYGAISGECDIILNGKTYEKAIVFNPMCNDNGEYYYSFFGMKKSSYTEILADGNHVVMDSHYMLADILFGKVPISFFSKETRGNEFINSILNRNLMLPETYYLRYSERQVNGITEFGDIEYSFTQKEGFKECHGTYIDIFDNMESSEVIETLNVNDDIYPKMGDETHNGEAILQVGLYNAFKDDDTDYEVGKWHYQYAFNTEFEFSEDAIIAGTDLRVRFTSGSMNGMEFDVQFYTMLESGLTMMDGSTLHNDKTGGNCFVISPNEDYGAELPNDVIFPKKDDRFILTGFDPTALEDDGDMVLKAERRLLSDAVKRANQIRNNTATYTATVQAEVDLDEYYIGRRVKVYDEAANTMRVSRIIGYDMCLDLPLDHPAFTIGQSAEYSRIRSVENYAGTKSDGKLN